MKLDIGFRVGDKQHLCATMALGPVRSVSNTVEITPAPTQKRLPAPATSDVLTLSRGGACVTMFPPLPGQGRRSHTVIGVVEAARLETQILRYYHAEKWTAGTIARQTERLLQRGAPRAGAGQLKFPHFVAVCVEIRALGSGTMALRSAIERGTQSSGNRSDS